MVKKYSYILRIFCSGKSFTETQRLLFGVIKESAYMLSGRKGEFVLA
jgi:hypothetical protein